MDKYESYKLLTENCKYDVDYKLEHSDLNFISPISVISIHAGGIEPGTSEITRKLSQLGNYQYFMFIGMRNNQSDCKENDELHITSNKFLDRTCLEIVGNSIVTISIHGCKDKESLTYVGGRNFIHRSFIKDELKSEGFIVPEKTKDGLDGLGPLNICNRNMRNMGVQLELSQGLRKQFFGDNWKIFEERQKSLNNELLNKYIYSIWRATQKYLNIP